MKIRFPMLWAILFWSLPGFGAVTGSGVLSQFSCKFVNSVISEFAPRGCDPFGHFQPFFETNKEHLWSLLEQNASGAYSDDEIWFDGDALRYYLKSLKKLGGERLDPLFDHLKGAYLKRRPEGVRATVLFDRKVVIPLKPRAEAKYWELYQIDVPETIAFNLNIEDGIVSASGLAEGTDRLRFKVKIPVLPDTVLMRNLRLDLDTGEMRIVAGVIGNTLIVVAHAQMMEMTFDGIDLWESLLASLRIKGHGALSGIFFQPAN